MQSALNDEQIVELDPKTLLSSETLDNLYDITDDLERSRLKALLISRAREFKLEKEYISVLRAYDNANQKLADEYTRKNAVNNSDLPLIFNKKGKPMETIENLLLVLRNDERFKNVKFNLLSVSPELHDGKEIAHWDDTCDSKTKNYIEKTYEIYSPTKLEDALRIFFFERSYHPVKEIIEGAEWDGVERISTLLVKWLKCKDTPYTREVSRLIFAGGINRLYNNGCKFDEMPVLIGKKQGEGKSTFVRWLALKDEFFRDVCEFEGQKGIEAIEGGWICEVGELLALTKTKEQEAVKTYISKLVDSYRKPYDKRVTQHKRACIFIGTTNKEQFLTDKTGNRRFYPIATNQIGYDLFAHEAEVKADVLQCWAEAKAKFDKGEMLPYANRNIDNEIKEIQANSVEDDYRIGMIEEYLQHAQTVCTLELWQKALRNEFSKPTKKDSNEIVLIMQNFTAWVKSSKAVRTSDYGVQKVWEKIEPKICNQNEYESLPFEP